LRPKYFDSLDILGANAKVSDVIRMMRGTFTELKPLLLQNKATAATYNIPLIIYEGGQSLVPQGGTNHPYNNALFDAQIDTAMYNITNELLAFVRDFVQAKLFMYFNLITDRKNDMLGSFGALESIYQNPPYKIVAPKYQVLLDNIYPCDSIPVTLYNLTVNSGTGSGSYKAGDTIVVIAGAAPIGYIFEKWSGDTTFLNDMFNDTTILIMPEKDISISANYIERNTSVETYGEQICFDIYPNPANNDFNIKSCFSSYSVSIIDPLGIEIKYEVNSTKIDVSKFIEGIYFVKFSHSGLTFYKKIVIIR
jgi:hypothetical protein